MNITNTSPVKIMNITNTLPVYITMFSKEGHEFKMWLNDKGEFCFEGDVNESALAFIDRLKMISKECKTND